MNWGELKAAVVGYLHRADASAMMPVWLTLAEQRIYFGEQNTQPLRLAAMIRRVTLAGPARPADFLEARKVLVSGGAHDRPLEYRPLERLPLETRAFSWDGQNMVLSPDMDWPVQLLYYGRLDTPSVDGDSNWLLQNVPGVYLAAMLIEAAKWSRDELLLVREVANYTSAASAAQKSDQVAQHSGSPLAARLSGRVA